MKTYKPGPVSNDELRRELASIEQAQGRADPLAELNYLAAEPKKLRPGILVLADGTNWNPGSGEGAYRRNAANTAWVFLG